MPIDKSLLPALRQELEYAKHLKPGGQPVDEGRVAAIEAQIKLHESAGDPIPSPDEENESNKPTDYSENEKSTKKSPKADRAKQAAKDAEDAKKADDAKETATGDEPVETADA